MQRLLMVGLNHTTAPLPVRERLAFTPEQRAAGLDAFRERFPDAEAVLISTCNRVELYAARTVHGHPRLEEMIDFLASCHGIPATEIDSHLYRKTDRDAVHHLFSVASSLDSMVLGETQILGQVRSAYDSAHRAQLAGALLHPLFQRAIAVGKQVMNSTGLNEGRLSVASVAVDYARQIFDHFSDKTILSIGAGKMATLVLQGFTSLAPGKLLVCNRDLTRATALAERFGGQPAPFDELDDHLVAADIVISSTGASHPIITGERFEHLLRQRRYRPIFLIDIAMPRDIESAVGEIENVYLYNIDDLQQVVAATQSQRAGALAEARQIVERSVEEFAAWHRARELGPVIDRLYQRYHDVAREEVDRIANKLSSISPEDRQMLDQLARRIVNKLLHDPIQTLRSANGLHAPGAQYLHAMERLFKLTEDDEEEESSGGQEKTA